MINPSYQPPGIAGTRQENASSISYPVTPLLGALLSRLPYAQQLLDNVAQNNTKFELFKNTNTRREDLIEDESVFLQPLNTTQSYGSSYPGGDIVINKDYQAFIYATLDKDKARRLMDYRRMAAYAELADCLDEICDECIVKDENDKIVNFTLRGDYSQQTKDQTVKEFDRFIRVFDLENKGWEYFRQFLIDGELFFENVVSYEKPGLGIVGVVNIPAEVINPVYHNTQNEVLKGFLLTKDPSLNQSSSSTTHLKDVENTVILPRAQVTYINSGIWNEYKTIRLPYIENAKRAYRQLSLIEDSVVIYRLVRAPERLVFKVYTGNMPAPKAEAHIRRLMQRYWSRKNYDASKDKATNVYDPQSMLDAYWFPVDHQGKGTEVSTLASGGNLGEIRDLDYFLTKLYRSLKIPASRMINNDTPFKDGAEITRDELRFARFIMRIQRQFAMGIRQAFVVHLRLRGLWSEFKLKEHSINIEFNVPTTFMAMREQQMLETKFNNYSNALNSQTIAPSFAQKYYLGFNDGMMRENREWQRKDAALTWELEQIKNNGPDFRQQVSQQSVSGAGGPGPSGGGIPSFGSAEGASSEVPSEEVTSAEETGSTGGEEVPPTDTSSGSPTTNEPPTQA